MFLFENCEKKNKERELSENKNQRRMKREWKENEKKNEKKDEISYGLCVLSSICVSDDVDSFAKFKFMRMFSLLVDRWRVYLFI